MEGKIDVSTFQEVATAAINDFWDAAEHRVDDYMQEFLKILKANMDLNYFKPSSACAKTIGFEVEKLPLRSDLKHVIYTAIWTLEEGQSFQETHGMTPYFEFIGQPETKEKQYNIAGYPICDVTPLVTVFEKRGLKGYVYKHDDNFNLIFAFEI